LNPIKIFLFPGLAYAKGNIESVRNFIVEAAKYRVGSRFMITGGTPFHFTEETSPKQAQQIIFYQDAAVIDRVDIRIVCAH